MKASGGDDVYEIEIDGREYAIHAFTETGEHTFEVEEEGEVDVLVVAGGGGGGNDDRGGGGGAGGLVFVPELSLDKDSYDVTIGAGGSPDSSGNDSVFDQLVALGGGRGSDDRDRSSSYSEGGSGGGAARHQHDDGSHEVGKGLQPEQDGLSGECGFGNDGGESGTDSWSGAGGGGGALEAGKSGTSGETSESGGDGGDGKYFGDKFGNDVGEDGYFAGGGGGLTSGTGDYGEGGKGGGGKGGARASNVGDEFGGTSGLKNTGGGGGGLYSDADGNGDGGSGIVLVRYPLSVYLVFGTIFLEDTPVENAQVFAVDQETDARYEATTDENGEYEIEVNQQNPCHVFVEYEVDGQRYYADARQDVQPVEQD